MKNCNKCNIEKPLNLFGLNGRTPKGTIKYRPMCKPCEAETINDRFYNIVLDIFTNYSCKCCGYENGPKMVEYHHLDPKEKEDSPGHMKSHGEKRIREELEKCIQVCPNCHREIHYGLRELP